LENLKKAIYLERSRLFVGRKSELEQIRDGLTQTNLPTQVVFVSGMGGIGKSSLLLQCLQIAEETGIFCVWLDARTCTESPSGFLATLHSLLFPSFHPRETVANPISDIVGTLNERRTLLCIDNYDHLQKIDGWLREAFFPELPARNLLIILAGRQDLMVEWQFDPAWRERLVHNAADTAFTCRNPQVLPESWA
jgi:hypothetical protein